MRTLTLAVVLAILSYAGVASGESDGPVVAKVSVLGPVSATVRVKPETVRIGDPIELEIEVVAQGQVELLMPVFGESLERFRILDFAPRERIDEQGRTVASQRYRLQVMTSGEHTIPAIMIEFVDHRPGERAAPDDEDAYELLTEPVVFEVLSVTPAGSSESLRPPLGSLEPLVAEQDDNKPWLFLIVLLLLLSILVWRVYLRWSRRTRQLTAYEVAFARLSVLRARSRPDAVVMDAFFVELSDIVRRYLEDRFALHAPELTTEEFLEVAVASPDLDEHRQHFLRGFLGSADQVKFARHVPDLDHVESVLAAVADFLEQTRATTDTHSASVTAEQAVA